MRPTESVPYVATLSLLAVALTLTGCGGQSNTSTSNQTPPGPASITVSPTSANLDIGATSQFSATLTNAGTQTALWSVDGVTGGNSSVGTISSSGLYTAPSSAGNHTVTAALSGSASTSATASVSVFSLTISPQTALVAPSATQQYSATLQGSSNTSLNWTVDGVAGGNSTTGTVNSSGLYTAPASIGAHTITATSASDSSISVSASVTVVNISQSAVLTFHNDDARDGAYLEEVTLTPSNVNSTQFGKLISYPVDGQISAQPLYLPQLSISSSKHDVVFVATQNNSLYAFDADATSQPTTFWHVNFGIPVVATGGYGPWPGIGIAATPVIDATTNVIYLVADVADKTPQFWLHAINAETGQDLAGSPVGISASYSGESLDGSCYQRMGLALDPVTNFIYITFGSCAHGWVVSYDKTSLAQEAVLDDTAGGSGGGLWDSGAAPAVDDTTGDVYLLSGTDAGDQEWITGSTMVGYNDAFLRLDANSLAVKDYFAPYDNFTLASNDVDLGSGGNILVPGSTTYPDEVLGGGKDGNIFVVNRNNMGGFNDSTNNVLQTVPTGHQSGTLVWNNIYCTPVYWNGNLYFHPNGDVLHAFSWSAGADAGQQLSAAPTSSSTTTFNGHGATPSLSANGTNNGIVWDMDNSTYSNSSPASSGPAVLHAYEATNVANELYNSTQAGTRDTAGPALKFAIPTIANGRVFVPTTNELDIYGLLPQ